MWNSDVKQFPNHRAVADVTRDVKARWRFRHDVKVAEKTKCSYHSGKYMYGMYTQNEHYAFNLR